MAVIFRNRFQRRETPAEERRRRGGATLGIAADTCRTMRAVPVRQGSRISLLVTTTLSMWVVWIVDLLWPGPLGHGVVPRTSAGLVGIAMAPFLHASLQHLLANTIPYLILGALILLRGAQAFLHVLVASALISGIGIWIFGTPNSHHIGASGVVFGFLGYLLLRGVYDRRVTSVLIAIAVALLYGATFLIALIPAQGVSWTAHFFGFVGGAMAARTRSSR